MLTIPLLFLALLYAIWIAVGDNPLVHAALAFLFIGIGFILDIPEDEE